MTYCPNRKCDWTMWQTDDHRFCRECGTELTPCIKCLCGEGSYNPRQPDIMGKFCTACGTEWTEAYLATCMSQQLKGMLKDIKDMDVT